MGRTDLRDRELRAREERADDFALLVLEPLLELDRDALLVGVGFGAFDLGVELAVELALKDGQLFVRVDEGRQARDFGLIEQADVGDVGGDRRRRERRRDQRGGEEGRYVPDSHGFP